VVTHAPPEAHALVSLHAFVFSSTRSSFQRFPVCGVAGAEPVGVIRKSLSEFAHAQNSRAVVHHGEVRCTNTDLTVAQLLQHSGRMPDGCSRLYSGSGPARWWSGSAGRSVSGGPRPGLDLGETPTGRPPALREGPRITRVVSSGDPLGG
jgi:hypothetical protein